MTARARFNDVFERRHGNFGPTSILIFLLAFLALLPGCGRGAAELPQPQFIFGHTGMGPSEFNYPRAAVIGPNQLLYIVDKGGRIQAFNQDGQYQFEWHMPQIDAGKPTGLGVGPDGTIYAADTHYSRVIWFSPTGQELGRIGSFGDTPGQFHLPTDVAVSASGEIYVSEYGGNDRVNRFTSDWKFIDSFGGRDAGEASMERPQCLRFAPDGTLWICDSCHHRVCHFTADGKLLGAFGKEGHAPGEFCFPYNVELLSDGTLVVCEYGNNRVQHLTVKGEYLGEWGEAGRQPGQAAYPWALAVGKDDRLFIVDSGNNRVQVIPAAQRRQWRDLRAGK